MQRCSILLRRSRCLRGTAPPFHLGVTGDLYGSQPASFGFQAANGSSGGSAQTWTVGEWHLVTGTYDGVFIRTYVNDCSGGVDASDLAVLLGGWGGG
ncbi:MAG: hypothetical protein SGJ11_08110 [Phycisphaerae bacterium]|nr:hypothetical protein [Phycisphaerae bacterium]